MIRTPNTGTNKFLDYPFLLKERFTGSPDGFLADVSGNGRHLTNVSAVYKGQQEVTSGVFKDGFGEGYANISDTLDITKDFTASFYFRVAANTSQFAWGSYDGANNGCELELANGTSVVPQFTIYNGTSGTSATWGNSLVLNTTYLVEIDYVVATKALRIRVDGGAWMSAVHTGTATTGNTLDVGARGNGASPLLADAAIFGLSITNDGTTWSQHDFSPISKKAFEDASGNNHHLIPSGGVPQLDFSNDGVGYLFDGIDDYADTNGSDIDVSGKSWSYEGWVKFSLFPSVMRLFDLRGNGGAGFIQGIQISTSGTTFGNIVFDDGATNYVKVDNNNTTLVTNKLYHIIVVFDYSTKDFILYIDGTDDNAILTKNGTLTTFTPTYTHPRIGAAINNETQKFYGTIYKTRFWLGTVISASQAAILYNSGIALGTADLPSSLTTPTLDLQFNPEWRNKFLACENDGYMTLKGDGTLTIPAQSTPVWGDLGLMFKDALVKRDGLCFVVDMSVADVTNSSGIGFSVNDFDIGNFDYRSTLHIGGDAVKTGLINYPTFNVSDVIDAERLQLLVALSGGEVHYLVARNNGIFQTPYVADSSNVPASIWGVVSNYDADVTAHGIYAMNLGAGWKADTIATFEKLGILNNGQLFTHDADFMAEFTVNAIGTGDIHLNFADPLQNDADKWMVSFTASTSTIKLRENLTTRISSSSGAISAGQKVKLIRVGSHFRLFANNVFIGEYVDPGNYQVGVTTGYVKQGGGGGTQATDLRIFPVFPTGSNRSALARASKTPVSLPVGAHAWMLEPSIGQGIYDFLGNEPGYRGGSTSASTDDPTPTWDSATGTLYFDFDGGDFITLPKSAFQLATDAVGFGFVFVIQPNDGQPAASQYLLGAQSVGSVRLDLFISTAGKISLQIGANTSEATTALANGAYSSPIAIGVWHDPGNNQTHYFINSLTVETVAHTADLRDLLYDVFVGADNSSGTPGGFYTGRIYRDIVMKSAPTLAEMQAEIARLANKHSIILS